VVRADRPIVPEGPEHDRATPDQTGSRPPPARLCAPHRRPLVANRPVRRRRRRAGRPMTIERTNECAGRRFVSQRFSAAATHVTSATTNEHWQIQVESHLEVYYIIRSLAHLAILFTSHANARCPFLCCENTVLMKFGVYDRSKCDFG